VAIEHTLLGLLEREPRHGYDLAREFTAGTVLGEIVHLEPSMLYAYLKKLEGLGQVRSIVQTQGARPPRKVFELTDDGERALVDWLSEPVEHTRDLRLEFLLKLAIARERPDDDTDIRALFERQHAVCETFVASLRAQLDAEEDEFKRLIIEMRLAQNQALLDWLARARDRVVS
jgi:DNA-binding PadR family transcriptional regulator